MRRNQCALSLIELVIALALAGTLLSIALPSFGKLLQDNRDEALRNLLLAQLKHTREQAIMTNRQYWLCGSSDGVVCDGNWSSNWLMVTANASQVIQRQQLPKGNGLCWRGFNKDIRFHKNGTAPISNGRFSLCRDGKRVWTLTINRQGRVRDSSAETPPDCCLTNHTGT